MNENAQLITVMVGVVIPLMVGVLAKAQASSQVKALLNAGLTGLGGALAAAQLDHWAWKGFFISWGSTWVMSVGSYYGLLKPSGAAAAVQGATANVGIGKAVSTEQ